MDLRESIRQTLRENIDTPWVLEYSLSGPEEYQEAKEKINAIRDLLEDLGAEYVNVDTATNRISMNIVEKSNIDKITDLMKQVGYSNEVLTTGLEDREAFETQNNNPHTGGTRYGNTHMGWQPTRLIGEY